MRRLPCFSVVRLLSAPSDKSFLLRIICQRVRVSLKKIMHKFQRYLPEHWNSWITEFAKAQTGGKYDELRVDMDNVFCGKVRLTFEDGSHAFFEAAFYVEDESRKEVAVFTEHCGYHIFSSLGLQVKYYEHTKPRIPLSAGVVD